ncbi:hypothetical protein ACN082_09690 [Rothia sp. CCM 9417]|uniref:hypothetical protein n=1 Tax=Rothia sp. CCM 9417 TaxID=3402657 RepID=UPI003AE0F558
MPRRKNRGVWPVDLPKIRTHTITSIRDAARTDPEYATEHKHNAKLMEEAELWWVAKPMAILASHAKEDLPSGQTLSDNRPSLAGIIIYEGGTGITTEWLDAPEEHQKTSAFGQVIYPQVEVKGLVWLPGHILALADTPLVKRTGVHDKVFVIALSRSAQNHLEKLLITTWLLAEQPHLGVSRREPVASYGQASRPQHQPEIRVIKLRETPTHPEPWETESVKEGKKWAMKHRTVVSGHWRNQPYGPGRGSVKPIYIEPYLKGPSGAPIIVRPTVKVWSR